MFENRGNQLYKYRMRQLPKQLVDSKGLTALVDLKLYRSQRSQECHAALRGNIRVTKK